ncbi:hypothetical protein BBK14_26030 [Parafrankia soli]|uniref:Uncharacterized protein n=1 Tax=Parafrankia soli TaxID=2599596 RepID=A0A1S1PMH6_9ACTN|nr:hypothetical protein BBK14_26030 [Parafrankia soli]
MAALFGGVHDRLGRLDAVVNSAGIGGLGRIVDLPLAEFREDYLANTPLGRAGTPEEIAQAVLFSPVGPRWSPGVGRAGPHRQRGLDGGPGRSRPPDQLRHDQACRGRPVGDMVSRDLFLTGQRERAAHRSGRSEPVAPLPSAWGLLQPAVPP